MADVVMWSSCCKLVWEQCAGTVFFYEHWCSVDVYHWCQTDVLMFPIDVMFSNLANQLICALNTNSTPKDTGNSTHGTHWHISALPVQVFHVHQLNWAAQTNSSLGVAIGKPRIRRFVCVMNQTHDQLLTCFETVRYCICSWVFQTNMSPGPISNSPHRSQIKTHQKNRHKIKKTCFCPQTQMFWSFQKLF